MTVVADGNVIVIAVSAPETAVIDDIAAVEPLAPLAYDHDPVVPDPPPVVKVA